MSGQYGVKSIKSLITTAKLGAIAILQGIALDGFQPKDFIAPLSSPIFQGQAMQFLTNFRGAIPEVSELDLWDGLEIGAHLMASWKDLKTEYKLAEIALKAQRKTA